MCSVIIVAAGQGKRIGGVPKQFRIIAGKALLAYTVECFEACPEIDEIVVLVPEQFKGLAKEILIGCKKIKEIVSGGRERQDSVFNGLKVISHNAEIILIHDGVRPFVTNADITSVIEGARMYGSCLPAVLVRETVKIVGLEGFVRETPDRSQIFLAQTPQGFKAEIIKKAYEFAFKNIIFGTDDTVLVEKLGVPTKIIPGNYQNIKITTKEDLLIGEYLLRSTLQ